MARDRKAACIVCKSRKQVYANQCCIPCNGLVQTERTHELYGVQKEPAFLVRMREQIDTYNKLARKGFNRLQICEKMGLRPTQLTSIIYRAKARHGIKAVNLRESRFTGQAPAKPTTQRRASHNEHGGGKWGIRGCSCDPCKTVRSNTRKEYAQLYKPRKQELRAVAEREGRPPKKRVRAETPHGQGLTGKRNCRCDLCGPLKAAYSKSRNENKKKDQPS